MPFEDRSFDFVWSLESGEHMPDKAKFLQECYRVLKPGGKLMLATWCHRQTNVTPLDRDERKHLQENLSGLLFTLCDFVASIY